MTFHANVIGCNADQFRENYSKYITGEKETYFDNVKFALDAPAEIYDEIYELQEEGIYISEAVYELELA